MNRTTIVQQDKTSSLLPPTQGILQRKCACGNKTIAGGECTECAKKKISLQRKLSIGASNDPLEQEADRIANLVVATPAHSAISGAAPGIQRYTGQASRETSTAPASVDRVLASGGRPLDPALQRDMGQRFGRDFSRVRVHSGAAAEQSAREVGAKAYTVGYNIVFDRGRFAPGTHEGRRLLAHELTHVVQQTGSPMKIQRQGHTYTFLRRGSYGHTAPGITSPSCAGNTLSAGSAAPTVTVFARGTYAVRRDDGVVKAATCTRLAAGMAATRAHENSHVANVRSFVATANTAQGLPRTFTPPAVCPGAFLAAWTRSVNAALVIEGAHGPGAPRPTAQTFAQENAAGNCTFT